MNHRTAPVEIRELLATDPEGVRSRLVQLRSDGIVDEALLVSTCNRVELYAVTPPSRDPIRSWMNSFRSADGRSIEPHLYWHDGPDAVRHLFRVASALDSLVLGEPQILGQVKDAIRLAEEAGSMGRVLNRLTQRTLTVAKRVRTETALGRSRVGIGNAGVDLALQIFGTLDQKRAMLIGTGEMGRQVARALLNSGLEELIVVNRTYESAVELAAQFNGTPVAMERMAEYLSRVDVVVAATGARKPIIDAAMVRAALAARRYRPIFLVDLAVPRNIAEDVERVDQAFLFNVDDLEQVMDAGIEAREAASREATQLVDDEVTRFMQSLVEVDVGPRLGAITQRAEQMRVSELERSRRLLDSLDERQRADLDALTKALTKKILHQPLAAVRNAARGGDISALSVLLASWGETDD